MRSAKPLANLHRLFQGMMKSQQRWKGRRGLSSFFCCAILLRLNSAKTVTDSLPSLSQSICTLSLVYLLQHRYFSQKGSIFYGQVLKTLTE